MIDLLIASLCLQLNNVPEATKYYSSCLNASNAASIQYKIKPTIDGLEEYLQNRVKKETGERVWWLVGMGFAYQQKGIINLNVSARPIVDTIQLQANPNGSENVNLIWYF